MTHSDAMTALKIVYAKDVFIRQKDPAIELTSGHKEKLIFRDVADLKSFLVGELEEYIATHPWHRKFTEAQDVLHSIKS